jgi:cysteine synthase A
MLCDDGERYACTYYDDDWLSRNGLDWVPAEERIARLLG